MKNELYRRLEVECLEAIKGTVVCPDGAIVPLLGKAGGGCFDTIHPSAEEIIREGSWWETVGQYQ